MRAATAAAWAPPRAWDLGPEAGGEAYRAFFVETEARIHAFVDEPGRWQRLRREAAATRPADHGLPLAGVPVGVKDIFRVDGLPTRAGSRLPPDELAGSEAAAVARLRAAGALVLGKTVTTEHAYFEPGPTDNPRAPGHTPGGSSSGSAAAVAAGLCPLALGTQTIGSICRPAAFCAVVGFKPSFGRIPTAGVLPLAPSFDHVGVLAADLAWAGRAATVLCDGWRTLPALPRATVLGIPSGPYLEAADEVSRDLLALLVRLLAETGIEVCEVPVLADFAAVAVRHRRLVAAEAARAHARWYPRHRELYRPRTVELIETGRAIDDAELADLRAACGGLRHEIEAAMAAAGIDLWLTPAAPGPPPSGHATTGDPVMNLPWTQAGMPALALPAAVTGQGLPLGIQLVGRFGGDEELLARVAILLPLLEGRDG